MARHGTKNHAAKLFLLGVCRPPDPLLFLGGFQPPDPLAGGLQPPCPPVQFLRGSASQALHFSWYQDLGSPFLVGTLPQALFCDFFSRKMGPILLEAPNLGAGS